MTLAGLTDCLPPSTIEFFAVFARCEYALKCSGYGRAGYHGAVEPNWSRFASDLGETFFQRMKSSDAAQVLLEQPPKKQVLGQNGKLAWRDAQPPKDGHELLNAVKTVRNNLFHGGKFPDGHERDAARNEKLLQASLFVIKHAISANPQVRDAFEAA